MLLISAWALIGIMAIFLALVSLYLRDHLAVLAWGPLVDAILDKYETCFHLFLDVKASLLPGHWYHKRIDCLILKNCARTLVHLEPIIYGKVLLQVQVTLLACSA